MNNKFVFIFLLLIFPLNLKAIPLEHEEPFLQNVSPKNFKDKTLHKEKNSFSYFKGSCYSAIAAGFGIGQRHRTNKHGWEYSLNYAGVPYNLRLGLVSLKSSYISYNSQDPTSFYKGIGLEGGVVFFPLSFMGSPPSEVCLPFPNVELIFGKEFHSFKTGKRTFVQLGINTLPFVLGSIDKRNPILDPLIIGIAFTSISAGISF